MKTAPKAGAEPRDLAELREQVLAILDAMGERAITKFLFPDDNNKREFPTKETPIPHGMRERIPRWAPFNVQGGYLEQTKAPDKEFLYIRAVGTYRFYLATAGNGAGARTLTGAVVGDRVVACVNLTDRTNDAAHVEAEITVADQIQQLSTDHTGDIWLVVLSGRVTAGIEVF